MKGMMDEFANEQGELTIPLSTLIYFTCGNNLKVFFSSKWNRIDTDNIRATNLIRKLGPSSSSLDSIEMSDEDHYSQIHTTNNLLCGVAVVGEGAKFIVN